MTTVLTRAVLAAALLAGCSSQSPTDASPADASTVGASSQAIALTGARLIDGTGQPPIEPATLVINDGRVIAVGATDAVQIPDGAQQINLSGRTIIPGLVNTHDSW